jgi:hypothetical protein
MAGLMSVGARALVGWVSMIAYCFSPSSVPDGLFPRPYVSKWLDESGLTWRVVGGMKGGRDR